jgi:diguanylate cyclase (GGDEF)-like protein
MVPCLLASVRQRTDTWDCFPNNAIHTAYGSTRLAYHTAQSTNINKRLSRIIVASYVVIQLTIVVGTGFAIEKNWQVRSQASQTNLIRNAGIGNLLIETALLSASKSLQADKTRIESASQKGFVSNLALHELLRSSSRDFSKYSTTQDMGLLFFVNPQGLVYARSDVHLSWPIDMSDRFYFTDLRDHPEKPSTVGPLLLARTTGQWVFHMALPIDDANGHFAGVLVQQLLTEDIAADLSKYADTQSFEHMLIHAPNSAVSFVYPPPTDKKAHPLWAAELNHLISPATRQDGDMNWMRTEAQGGNSTQALIGVSTSPLLGLVSYAVLPLQNVWAAFFVDNTFLFFYIVCGFAFITGVFLFLYRVSLKLARAQSSSLHDPLTGLHNRRALDEQLPMLLHEAMREQSCLSVLFIDIDHFRLFNEHYGHESGDIALQAVATALAGVCQRPLDFICRWGGEEFVVVLPHTQEEAALKLANDMLQAVRALKLHVPHHSAPQISVSIGRASATITADTLEEDLVGAADQAMMHAKLSGRNQTVKALRTEHRMDTRMTCDAIGSSTRNMQRGAAAVEMAILLPLLMLMADGVLEFGLMLYDQSVLVSATGLAARAGIAQGPNKLDTSQISALASSYCQDKLISPMVTTQALITVVQSNPPTFQTPLQVTAQYNFKGLLIGGVMRAIQTNPQLSATTVMYNE